MTNSYQALSYRNFRLFWTGQFVSLIGTWMQNTVQPYLAYRLTNQPFYLGLIGFSSAIPALFITLPAGVYLERMNKRHVVIALQAVMMVQAIYLGILTLTGTVTIWHILALSFVLGLASAVEVSARQAMIAELIHKNALPNAIALNSAIFNAARVIGPSLTAPFLLLLHDNGIGWAFIANGISYLFVLISLVMMDNKPIISAKKEHFSWRAEFSEGIAFIRATPVVALLILVVTLPSFFGFPFSQQIPVFATDVFKTLQDTAASVASRNSLFITAVGAGALIAAVTLAVYSTLHRKGLWLTIGQITFAIAIIGFSLTTNLTVGVFLLVVAGWGTVTQLALTNTLIQLSVPDELRGRVISTYFWAQQGVAPFGSLFIGFLAQQAGAPAAVRIGGIVCLVGYLAVAFFKPTIRKVVVE
jgi:MFS family permease